MPTSWQITPNASSFSTLTNDENGVVNLADKEVRFCDVLRVLIVVSTVPLLRMFQKVAGEVQFNVDFRVLGMLVPGSSGNKENSSGNLTWTYTLDATTHEFCIGHDANCKLLEFVCHEGTKPPKGAVNVFFHQFYSSENSFQNHRKGVVTWSTNSAKWNNVATEQRIDLSNVIPPHCNGMFVSSGDLLLEAELVSDHFMRQHWDPDMVEHICKSANTGNTGNTGNSST